MDKTIPLYLITGFLGSGKTSVINNLISQLKDKKVGLILNDFGSITVDSALVKGLSEVVSTKSLSGGQIFCSCLSGSFIKSVVEMIEYHPDVIIVEASGLAKPTPLLEIVSIIQDQTHQKVTYGGMLCIVDADRFQILRQSLKTIEEQVVFSDWFIINKSDIASKESLSSTIASIESLRPLAPIFTTSFGTLTSEMMRQFNESTHTIPITLKDPTPYQGWGVHGRPNNCIFTPEAPFEISQIEEFFTSVAPYMLRMKGFIPLKEKGKALLVDVVGKWVKVGVTDMPASQEMGVMCIYSPQHDGPSLLQEKWALLSDSPATCIQHS